MSSQCVFAVAASVIVCMCLKVSARVFVRVFALCYVTSVCTCVYVNLSDAARRTYVQKYWHEV